MKNRFHPSRTLRALLFGLGLGAWAMVPTPVAAQSQPTVTGKIDWGLWVDPDGCMHWWSDGGAEGYMVPRRDPKTGRHLCLDRRTCAVQQTDTLFAGNSPKLTAAGLAWLRQFFASSGAFAYAVYGHTDDRAVGVRGVNLSQSRADAVAAVARETGSVVDTVVGLGPRRPVAPNTSAQNRQKNRRVEIVCYRYKR